jgi:flagellar basal body P-ring protein FlgI
MVGNVEVKLSQSDYFLSTRIDDAMHDTMQTAAQRDAVLVAMPPPNRPAMIAMSKKVRP